MATLFIYRASAGSGKTHTLVTKYIKWALRYPSAFKHILAVTFTNCATQEMKQRIVAYLYSLSIGEKSVLLEALLRTGWTLTQLQVRSREVLSMIVYHYGDFSVTTIDGFFYRIVQSFTRELGLKYHFSIEMDEALPLEETVSKLVTQPLLRQWIVNFALTKLLAGKTWNVKNDIQNMGKALFKESFKVYEKELLTVFENESVLPNFLAAIEVLRLSFEQKMQEIGERALKTLQQEELEPEDFAYGTKGVIGYFLKLVSKKNFAPTKRAIAGQDDLKYWFSKTKTNKAENIKRVVETILHPLLIEAIILYNQEGLRYRTAVVVSRLTHSFGIVRALLLGLAQYRSHHNVLFISDIATLLYQIIQENDTPFFYEKISNRFHHFLIDEFQDLSLFQWINIKPLLRNSLAQGYSSLLVGDIKQSIYRWRGSNWKLLNHEVAWEFKESKRCALTTNRRSLEMIVLFNNNFFKTASSQLVHYLESNLIAENCPADLLDELAQMSSAYDDVAQQVIAAPTTQKAGYVSCLFLKSDQIDATGKAISWKESAQKEVIALVEMLQKEGVKLQDIVLLVRNNSEAALLTSLCIAYAKVGDAICCYTVGSDYASFLWSHMAIKVLIHALYYLNNEDDLINTMAWIASYCVCMKKPPVIWHHHLLIGASAIAPHIKQLIPQSFWEQKDFLKNISVYASVGLLIEIFFDKNHDYNAILAYFHSIVLACFATEGASIAAFLSWWEKRGKSIKLPVNNNENTIQVMTIHQSKGLEFKVVIIPFCSWNLDHLPQNGPTLWGKSSQESPFNCFPVFPLVYGVDLKETAYAKDYHIERIQTHLDNLNLLYVAFTRAETQLYLMAPLPEKIEGMSTTSDLIYHSLRTQQSENKDGMFTGENLVASVKERSIGTQFSFGSVSNTISLLD